MGTMHQSDLIGLSPPGIVGRVGPPVAAVGEVDGPPVFVRLASHPLRWRLLRELVQSDRAVKELMTLIDEPQSLVSYHLRLLRDGGLVTARRSSADRPRQLLRHRPRRLSRGAAGAPAARCTQRSDSCQRRLPVNRPGRSRRRPRVLFLCTGNSARSQIAEALLERMSGGAVEAASAGSHPKSLHPNAVRVLRQAWNRHQREPHQAPRRVRLPALRHGDHPVRPGSRGLPGVPVRTRARPLERSRPGARGSDQPCVVPGVRAHRRRTRDAHRLPAPSVRTTPSTARRSAHVER